ncbi:acetyl-CoA carboxylase biotin carboxylase subunit family protein [Amycolatopsis sp. lyj-84]|uniref:ATP-grasp domain-containing protein n=1 Tax=Amycolatopsis sp. lyj-84 TaxID=2789284 RepID=UPI00397B179A
MTGPLVVVYDQGAAPPGEIAVGLASLTPCLFAIPVNEHTTAMRPLLEQFGRVTAIESVDGAARELAARGAAGIVTYSEKALRLTGELARALDLPYLGEQTLTYLTDKAKQRSALRAAGVDAVRFHPVTTPGEWAAAVAETGLPAVLKPLYGGASMNTYLIHDSADGEALARRLLSEGAPGYDPSGGLILEEYLPGRDCGAFGDYVSVENVVVAGRIDDLAVTGKLPMVPPFRETGRFWPSPLERAEDDEMQAVARGAIAALGITTGLVHTEFKLTPDGPRLIEVNGRLGGGISELSIRALGVNLIEIGGRIALGEDVHVPPPPRDAVFFQQFHPAPRRKCVLDAIDGGERVRELPGVSVYRPFGKPGTTLPGGVHTHELDMTIGRVGDHAELAGLTAAISGRLVFRFTFEDGPRAVSGAEIGAL